MALAGGVQGKLDDAQAQITRLREQMDALMKDRVTPALADFAGRAGSAVQDTQKAMRGQADSVAGQVRDRPLIAILIALGIGWIIGRAMR